MSVTYPHSRFDPPSEDYLKGKEQGLKQEHLTHPDVRHRDYNGIGELATLMGYVPKPGTYGRVTPERAEWIKGYLAGQNESEGVGKTECAECGLLDGYHLHGCSHRNCTKADQQAHGCGRVREE